MVKDAADILYVGFWVHVLCSCHMRQYILAASFEGLVPAQITEQLAHTAGTSGTTVPEYDEIR